MTQLVVLGEVCYTYRYLDNRSSPPTEPAPEPESELVGLVLLSAAVLLGVAMRWSLATAGAIPAWLPPVEMITAPLVGTWAARPVARKPRSPQGEEGAREGAEDGRQYNDGLPLTMWNQ